MTPGQLAELREMHRDNGTNDDKWRVLGYQKGSFVIRDLSLSCSKLWLAIGSLKAYPSRIKSREEALKLRGISDKTADKVSQFTAYLDSDLISFQIMEIIRTGELQRIKYTKTEDLKVMRLFSGIYGVGQFLGILQVDCADRFLRVPGSSTARKWFHQGLKSLDDIKRAVQNGTHKLSAAQEVGVVCTYPYSGCSQ